MSIDEEFADFVIVLLKCFFILIFWGLLLPKFLDYFISKPNVYDNSILVHNIVNKNLDIIYKYITVFNEFLRLWDEISTRCGYLNKYKNLVTLAKPNNYNLIKQKNFNVLSLG